MKTWSILAGDSSRTFSEVLNHAVGGVSRAEGSVNEIQGSPVNILSAGCMKMCIAAPFFPGGISFATPATKEISFSRNIHSLLIVSNETKWRELFIANESSGHAWTHEGKSLISYLGARSPRFRGFLRLGAAMPRELFAVANGGAESPQQNGKKARGRGAEEA